MQLFQYFVLRTNINWTSSCLKLLGSFHVSGSDDLPPWNGHAASILRMED